MSTVPLPPTDAEQFKTVCQFCIVGCGYRVFRWPVGRDGNSHPTGNLLGVDYRKQLPTSAPWLSPANHTQIVDKNGARFNVIIVPDENCSVNRGLSSVRGGGLAATLYAPDKSTNDRLHSPLLSAKQKQVVIDWDEAVDLGSRVIKAVIDRWGADAIGMKFFDHGGGGGGFENNWAVGRFFSRAFELPQHQFTTDQHTTVKCTQRQMRG